MTRSRRFPHTSALVVAAVLALTLAPAGAPLSASADGHTEADVAAPAEGGWRWPLHGFRLVREYRAPAHEYGPGHRGIDLAPSSADRHVYAPAAGRIAFAGPVAGRSVVTVDVGDGLVITLEPVDAAVAEGTSVIAGAPLGTVADGGHTVAGAVHFGVRRDGEYINPLALLGGVPRAVLLPCCS